MLTLSGRTAVLAGTPSPSLSVLTLAVFLLALGVGIFWYGAYALYAMLDAISGHASMIDQSHAPFYQLIAGGSVIVLGGAILKARALRFKLDRALMRLLALGLFAAALALIVLPPVANNFIEKQLAANGYIRCGVASHGMWASATWTTGGSMDCLFQGRRRD